jgi:hypothetical protein
MTREENNGYHTIEIESEIYEFMELWAKKIDLPIEDLINVVLEAGFETELEEEEQRKKKNVGQ